MERTILITTSSFNAQGFGNNYKIVKNPYKRKLTEQEVLGLVLEYQPIGMIAGVEPLTNRVMKAAKHLKVISRCGVGVDSVDIKAATELGIKVMITPQAPSIAVAELTLGLMLSALLHIPELDRGIKDGGWKGPKGKLLFEKTIGIIGCGRIGTRVASLCSAFGCKIIGYDPFIKLHETIDLVSLDILLETCDIISLHIPINDKNRNIIGRKQLRQMKAGSVIINAARGGLINEDALYDVLVDGHLSGAALDCFVNEPYMGNLLNAPNLVMTPHMGSSAVEARMAMEKQAVENLMSQL